MAALAAWLLAFDIARRTVRKSGLTRYIAASLLAGYFWLGVAGLLGLRFGGETAGLHYDAFLHSIFVGFVFSMILAHAPIILPAVTGLPLAFHRGFYVPLALLQASLALRVVGDLLAVFRCAAGAVCSTRWRSCCFWPCWLLAVRSGRKAGQVTTEACRIKAGTVRRNLPAHWHSPEFGLASYRTTMPTLTRLYVKTSLVYLVAALLLALVFALAQATTLPPLLAAPVRSISTSSWSAGSRS